MRQPTTKELIVQIRAEWQRLCDIAEDEDTVLFVTHIYWHAWKSLEHWYDVPQPVMVTTAAVIELDDDDLGGAPVKVVITEEPNEEPEMSAVGSPSSTGRTWRTLFFG